MGARYRICETCVYFSFAGNCDRYDKPLTSIEQPACDAYEIHPLLDKNDKLKAENAKLRELVQGLWFTADYLGMNPDGATGRGFARQMHELGIEVEQ